MPFDSFMTSAVVSELKHSIIGLKVDKICQPEKDEIDFVFNKNGRKRLVVNCSANNSYTAMSNETKENPAVPPMMCMLLRKHLSRAKLTAVEQLNFDRIIKLSFSAGDEMGFVKEKNVYCEMMGRGSNFVFADENGIITAAFRQNDITTKFDRIVMVGTKYSPMPLMDKFSPIDFDISKLRGKFEDIDKSMPLEKAVTNLFYGFGKLTAREAAFIASGKIDGTVGDINFEKFLSAIEYLKDIVINEKFSPCLVFSSLSSFNNGEAPIDFSFIPIRQYGNDAYIQKCDTASEAIENYYLQKDREERKKQHYNDIYQILKTCKSRLEKKIEVQREELNNSKDFEKHKIFGDLIISNLHKINDGDEKLQCQNFYSDECENITIMLDKRFSASHNAQLQYREYSKKKTAISKMNEQIEIANKELEYVDSVISTLSSAKTGSDLNEIREELSHWNYGRRLVSTLKKPSAKNFKVGVHKIKTPSGKELLVGLNNMQNEKITFSLAEKNDLWFHVKKYHGSHVVLKTDGSEPFDGDIEFAASVAATFSELSEGTKVEVDYTPVKYIKKPVGARIGFVTYKTNKSILVRPLNKNTLEI